MIAEGPESLHRSPNRVDGPKNTGRAYQLGRMPTEVNILETAPMSGDETAKERIPANDILSNAEIGVRMTEPREWKGN